MDVERRIATIEDILGEGGCLAEEWVQVPEWGGAYVHLREPSVAAVEASAARIAEATTSGDWHERNAIYWELCVVEPKLTRAQIDAMSELSTRPWQRVISAVYRLVGAVQQDDKDSFRGRPRRSGGVPKNGRVSVQGEVGT